MNDHDTQRTHKQQLTNLKRATAVLAAKTSVASALGSALMQAHQQGSA